VHEKQLDMNHGKEMTGFTGWQHFLFNKNRPHFTCHLTGDTCLVIRHISQCWPGPVDDKGPWQMSGGVCMSVRYSSRSPGHTYTVTHTIGQHGVEWQWHSSIV